MEKKYLELTYNGKLIGAFEDVKVFEERENEIYLECADGNFTIPKNTTLPSYYGKWYSPQLHLGFDEYNLCGRRALRRHSNDLDKRIVKRVDLGGK